MDCLLDTGAIVAMAIPRDQHHNQARDYSLTPGLRFVTTTAVVGEAYTLLRRRLDYRLASAMVTSINEGSVTRVHEMPPALEAETWAVIHEFAGVPLSYVDATLVALGRRLRIRRVFAFDDDFARAGLILVPEPGS